MSVSFSKENNIVYISAKSQFPHDISLRYAVCAGASTRGLTLEIQAHSATLNSHPLLNQPLYPAVLVVSIPLSGSFFREGGLYGPKPTIFVMGEKEKFEENISNSPEIFCSGKVFCTTEP